MSFFSISENFKLPDGRISLPSSPVVGKETLQHRCNPRNTARVQTRLNSHLSELVQTKRLDDLTQAHLARRLRVENGAENVFSQEIRKQSRTDLTNQQNWSGDVEEGRGCGNKAPQSSWESSLSPLCLLLGTRLHNNDRPWLWLKDEFPFSTLRYTQFQQHRFMGVKGFIITAEVMGIRIV